MLENAKNLKPINPVTVDGVPYEAYELQDIPAEEWNAIARREAHTINSREVAQMVEKNHKELLRDIRTYVNYMTESIERNFAPNDFFLESQYLDSIGRTLPCYEVTKMGCEMIANKQTGKKGILFTAAYVKRFNEMEAAAPVDTLTARLDKLIAMLERQYQAPAQPLQIEQKPKYDMDELKKRKLLTRKEAAFYIGVSPTTMHNIMHGVTFPALVRVGSGKGRVLVNREVFDAWIDTRTGGRPLPI